MADPHDIATLVDRGLAAAGLAGALFDPATIGLDLADRLDVDDGLDGFVGPGDPGAPAPFSAGDPR